MRLKQNQPVGRNKPANVLSINSTDTKQLIVPIIKTGVNPVDGSENKYDVNYTLIGLCEKYMADYTPSYNVAIAERRGVLTSVFYNRAYSLFNSVLTVVNNNFKIELSQLNLTADNYDSYESFDWFNLYNVISTGYRSEITQEFNRKYPRVKSVDRSTDSKLLDILFYSLPDETVYEEILAIVARNANDVSSRMISMQLSAESYNELSKLVYKYTGELFGVMEMSVSLLLKDANSLRLLGLPGEGAMDGFIDYKATSSIVQAVQAEALHDSLYDGLSHIISNEQDMNCK